MNFPQEIIQVQILFTYSQHATMITVRENG